MSQQPVTAIQASTTSKSPAVQADYQVKQLESQIKDWSSCPTTPPAIKKQIVAKLQFQLDSLEAGLVSHAKNAQAESQSSTAQSKTEVNRTPATTPPAGKTTYPSTFKFDVYT